MKRTELRLPTVLGLLVVVAGLVSGLYLLRGHLNTALFASADETPKDVRVTNANDSGFTVSWLTDKATSGFVQYGESAGSIDMVVSDDRDQQKGVVGSYFTHFVTIKGLAAAKSYVFKLGSGRNLYDSGGQPYQAATGATLGSPPPADVAYGQVVSASNDPAEGAIVFLGMQGTQQASALVTASGSWVIPLATLRSLDLSGYFNYDKTGQKINLLIQGGSLGVSSLVTTTGNDKPIPAITLGKDYDYTTTTETVASSSGTEVSKFSASALAPAVEVAGSDIVILSPKFSEKVNTTKPEIIGTAPAGTTLKIEVHSQNGITGQIKTGADGTFDYTVPTDLTPGDHTITISGLINGVLKQITRSFTVYAAGENVLPAFSATPSATIVPSPTATPKPTAVPKPTLAPTVAPTVAPTTPTPSATPTLVPTPTVVVAASASATPVSGEVTPTLIMLTIGAIMMAAGSWMYKKYERTTI